jgi:hypothetical protein
MESSYLQEPYSSRSQTLKRWIIEGARTSVFLRPRWHGLRTGPMLVACLVVADILLEIAVQRLYLPGSATFRWQAITGGWLGTALVAWNSYLLRPAPASTSNPRAAPTAAHMLTMLLAQGLGVGILFGALYVVLLRSGVYTRKALPGWMLWALWLAPWVWTLVAQLLVLCRGGDKRRGLLPVAAATLIAGMAVVYFAGPPNFWRADREDRTAAPDKTLHLTQELMEAQSALLSQRLAGIAPRRNGEINLFVLTFAPYDDDVFRRESGMVAQVMEQRFHAEGHVLQLVNHVDTLTTWPWATTLNLQRAIKRFASVMNRDEDILFIHLTSHGGSNGELAADYWPLEVDKLHPRELKRWLDEAGIRNRVISISACYSGSWIKPLVDDNTLVMTAADADHTSYGCGSKSELTFFGRAMYDEQLRNKTLSFEEAYRVAREVIAKREQEAGKDDGFSNPQIAMGKQIRGRLAELVAYLQDGRKDQ